MKDVATQYRDLLVADESIETLDRALRLAHQLTEPPARRVPLASNVERVAEVIQFLSVVAPSIIEQADQLPEGRYSLLMDVLLLVFHHAYYALLPIATRHRRELHSAFTRFSEILDRPADRFHTRGMVELERQNYERATDSFRAALAATHSDDHDFITRVQMAWTLLMERHRVREAFDCLLDVYPRVSRQDMGEVQAMLRQTFIEGANPKQRQPRNGLRGSRKYQNR